jgi:hypothetical protein
MTREEGMLTQWRDPEAEQAILEQITIDEPWALLERFSTLERLSGSQDEAEAVAYIQERLESWGIPYRLYHPTCLISLPRRATLRTLAPVERPIRAKTLSFSPSTDGHEIVGELVYVPGEQPSDIAGVLGSGPTRLTPDVRGKVILTDGMGMAARGVEFGQSGALGVIFIHPGQYIHEGIATTSWGSPDLDALGRVPHAPLLSIARPDGEWLKEQLAKGPVTVALSTVVETSWRPIPVLVAEIPGSPATDEFVLLHAHLDSWHVGIGDNATGDATLLELARVFWQHRDRLRRTLRVAWWSGHSHGRYAGSTWFADTFAQDLVPNCIAHINCDSPGCRWATEYRDLSWMAEASDLLRTVVYDLTRQQATGTRPSRAGDYSFNNLGITGFLMLSSTMPEELARAKGFYPVGGCGGNIVWHTEDDTLEVADPDNLLRDMRVYAAAVLRVLNAPVHPFDYRATVRELEGALLRYQEAAGEAFDFGPAFRAAGNLLTTLDRFYELAETLLDREVDDPDVRRINAAQRALARHLVPLGYVRQGRFRHDPAQTLPPIPEVAPAAELAHLPPESDRWHAVRVHLGRGLNQVVWTLRAAQRRIAEILP